MKKIGLYIHIPFCTAKCSYCDFASFSAASERVQRQYVEALKAEIKLRCGGENNNNGEKFFAETVYVGGGTPSALYHGALSEIVAELKKYTDFEPIEFSIEANPESVTPEFVAEIKKIGVNRVSLGLQTASDRLLKNMRRHNYNDFIRAVELVRGAGIDNISADLMLGLPSQTLTDVEDSLNRLIGLKLNHISVYALKVEEGTPLEKSGFIANDDETAVFYQRARELLSNYQHYEVSNFALEGFECKHNMKYWTMQPYLGLGLNASSFDEHIRRTNTRDFDKYLSGHFDGFVENAEINFLTEYIMLGLRTEKGIDIDTLKNYGFDLEKNPQFNNFLNKNILKRSENTITINKDFFFLMNSVLSGILP